MKKFYLVIIPFVLTSCLYSFENECFRPIIQTVSSGCNKNKGEKFPYIAQFQKKNTIGHTDSNQRWKDILSCGAIKKGENDIEIIGERDKKGNIVISVVDNFKNCMSRKGYIYFYSAQCGYQNPKWDTGKCNL